MTQQQHLTAQESNERNGKDEIVITVIEVISPQARLDFLFSKICSLCNIFEIGVFNYMRQHANAYQGGFWDFYNLSNGGRVICNRQKVTYS
ncbi:hypothetical protein IR150_17160 [Providencia alcalifaciens]|uniref:hypothetical protein n=1 Tax=Providencia alcalifaciens TaxID=126385 RepID=UPI0015D0A495|nr:hypothetical protein [Providencia alcalifaciens]MBF0693195.1 hypothetical protein [Providencia alcalifaciens]NYS91699.1 hypothetical protein [Providencia alcalifaciens]